MNMRVAKEEISLLMPTSLSHYADEPRFAVESTGTGFFTKLRAALHWVAELPERHAVLMELNDMSERELADIGLQRAELSRVFDPAFKPRRGFAGQ